jgi:hypothetical protein
MGRRLVKTATAVIVSALASAPAFAAVGVVVDCADAVPASTVPASAVARPTRVARSAVVEIEWPHPIRTLHASLSAVEGTFRGNLTDTNGFRIHLSLPLTKLRTTEPLLVDFFRARLASAPTVELEARVARLSNPNELPSRQRVVFLGEVTAGPVVESIEVPATCATEGDYVHCALEATAAPSRFLAATPSAWGIGALDRIHLRGNVTFGPKKE